MSCETCPFIDCKDAGAIGARLQHNYDTNYLGCREVFPKWKPGLCHKGGRICAGYLPGVQTEGEGGDLTRAETSACV